MFSLFISMDPVFDAIQQNLNSALSIPFVSSAVTLGLAFYAYKAGPELPSFMEELFLNVFFRVFIGFMVLYIGTGNVLLSLVVSVVFIYGVGMLSGLKEGMFEGVKFPDFRSGITSGGPRFNRPSTEELQKRIKDLANAGINLPKDVLNNVSGMTNRQIILIDAKNRYITDYEKKIFNDNMDNNLKQDIVNWIKNNIAIKDLTNLDTTRRIVNQLLCIPLFNTMIKGVIFGDDYKNKKFVTVTDKDINDAKKIRTAVLFKYRYGYTDTNTGEKKMNFTCDTGDENDDKRVDGMYYYDDIKCNFLGTLHDSIEEAVKLMTGNSDLWTQPDGSIYTLKNYYLDHLVTQSTFDDIGCDWYKYDKSINY